MRNNISKIASCNYALSLSVLIGSSGNTSSKKHQYFVDNDEFQVLKYILQNNVPE